MLITNKNKLKKNKVNKNLQKVYTRDQVYAMIAKGYYTNSATYKVLEEILYRTYNSQKCFPTTGYLAKKFGLHPKSICRVTKLLEEMGIIRKFYRGYKRSRLYMLSGVILDPHFQNNIYQFFPFLRRCALSILLLTQTPIEEYAPRWVSLIGTSVFGIHVTYTKLGLNIINNLSDKYNKMVNKNWKPFKKESDCHDVSLWKPKVTQNRDESQPISYNNTKTVSSIVSDLLANLRPRHI